MRSLGMSLQRTAWEEGTHTGPSAHAVPVKSRSGSPNISLGTIRFPPLIHPVSQHAVKDEATGTPLCLRYRLCFLPLGSCGTRSPGKIQLSANVDLPCRVN